MIIWGWGHVKTTNYGEVPSPVVCARCNNQVKQVLLRDSTYFRLFFIPIFPYRTEYFSTCPVCGNSYQLSKKAFDETLAAARENR